jgi:hypothetical protein
MNRTYRQNEFITQQYPEVSGRDQATICNAGRRIIKQAISQPLMEPPTIRSVPPKIDHNVYTRRAVVANKAIERAGFDPRLTTTDDLRGAIKRDPSNRAVFMALKLKNEADSLMNIDYIEPNDSQNKKSSNKPTDIYKVERLVDHVNDIGNVFKYRPDKGVPTDWVVSGETAEGKVILKRLFSVADEEALIVMMTGFDPNLFILTKDKRELIDTVLSGCVGLLFSGEDPQKIAIRSGLIWDQSVEKFVRPNIATLTSEFEERILGSDPWWKNQNDNDRYSGSSNEHSSEDSSTKQNKGGQSSNDNSRWWEDNSRGNNTQGKENKQKPDDIFINSKYVRPRLNPDGTPSSRDGTPQTYSAKEISQAHKVLIEKGIQDVDKITVDDYKKVLVAIKSLMSEDPNRSDDAVKYLAQILEYLKYLKEKSK